MWAVQSNGDYNTPYKNSAFLLFRARHMICLSFTRNGGHVTLLRLPCDSPTTITRRAVPKRFFIHLEPNQLCICVSEVRVRSYMYEDVGVL